MNSTLRWKRSAFSPTCHIISGEESIGYLKNSSFKQISEGSIRDKKYQFRTKGLFKQETTIIDMEKGMEIGMISYNSWMTKATIRFADRVLNWKYDNGWQTRWSLFDDRGTLLKFSGGSSKGTIECKEDNDLFVLTGLFVTNYYQQALIVIIAAVFVPIWLTLFN